MLQGFCILPYLISDVRVCLSVSTNNVITQIQLLSVYGVCVTDETSKFNQQFKTVSQCKNN